MPLNQTRHPVSPASAKRRGLAMLAALTALPLAAVMGSGAAAAQDFDCNKPKLVAEQIVCGSRKLSALDERMAELYGRLWGRLDNDNREGLRDYQLAFLHTRNMCNRDARCIEGAYVDQIAVLEQRLARTPHRHHVGRRHDGPRRDSRS